MVIYTLMHIFIGMLELHLLLLPHRLQLLKIMHCLLYILMLLNLMMLLFLLLPYVLVRRLESAYIKQDYARK